MPQGGELLKAERTPSSPIALDHELWSPIDLQELKRLLDGAKKPWWIAGGVAVDLFLGSKTREHRDIDAAILRFDQLDFQKALGGWELWVPTGDWSGQPYDSKALFRRWQPGEFLGTDSQAWCRRARDDRWSLELLFVRSEGETWQFKRDPEIRRPIDQIALIGEDGIPFLAPEIVLLHKATSSFPGDERGVTEREIVQRDEARKNADRDFQLLMEAMSAGQRQWLRENLTRLKPSHRWLKQF